MIDLWNAIDWDLFWGLIAIGALLGNMFIRTLILGDTI